MLSNAQLLHASSRAACIPAPHKQASGSSASLLQLEHSRATGQLGSLVRCVVGQRHAKLHQLVCSAVRPRESRSSPQRTLEDKEDRVFRLDIDYLTFLGLDSKRKYKESEIMFSYDRLLNAPLDPGYSNEVAVGRKVLLDVAKEVALEQQERPYIESEMIDVPQKLMPSALAVLAEVGLYVAVLEIGHKVLDDWQLRKDSKRDILLALALAACGRATELLTKQAKIGLAFEQMEAALEFLEEAGFPPLAPGLAADVQQGLDNLKPQYILECLTSSVMGDVPENPDPEAITKRRTAIRLLRNLAQAPEQKLPSMVPSITPDYMHQVLRELSPTEVMQLANWQAVAVNPPSWCDLSVLQTAAAAHILAGLQQGRPALVKTASVVLRSAYERHSASGAASPAASGRSSPAAELLLEGGLCEFLLGDVDTAMRLLREACAAGASGSPPPPPVSPVPSTRAQMPRASQALAFVSHWSRTVGAAEGDQLPGLCILAECWIAQVAIPAFQVPSTSPPAARQLLKYFEGLQLDSLIVLYDTQTPALPQTLRKTLATVRSTLQQRATPIDTSSPAPAAAKTKSAGGRGSDVLSGLVGGLLVLAAGSAYVFSTHGGRQLLHSTFPAASASLYDYEQATQLEQLSVWDRALSSPELDSEAASALVHKWQALKAVSMGPHHAGDLLTGALAEPLLGHYQKKVEKFKEQGLYMRYKLWSVQIDEIDTSSLSRSGGFGVVVTTLNESAVLHAEDGTAADSYHSTYNAVYKVVRTPQGSWRIQDVKVVPKE